MSTDEHAVAKGEETVTLGNGFSVGGHGFLVACKGRDKHDECTFGQMEVGNQAVDSLEAVAGIDEDLRPAGPGGDSAILEHDGFKGTGGRGANGDDAPTGGFTAVDEVGSFLETSKYSECI